MSEQQKPLAVFGTAEDGALDQINTVLADERAVAGALMADNHKGYSMPIGGVVAYDNAISPSGVGFDIACGNKCVRTDMRVADLRGPDNGDVKPWMRLIQQKVSFGLGRSNNEPIDHELFDDPLWDEIDTEPGQPLKQKAAAQLGTVGSGNHYVDLLRDDDGYLWIANHFGSRGFGHTVATMGLRWAYGLKDDDRKVERDEPAVLDLDTEKGKLYLGAMGLAGEYAYAGRDYVIDQVLSILGRPNVTMSVHNHHNFAWLEDGLWVVRKGATPLTTEPAFIGGSMGDVSVIVRGKPELLVAGGIAYAPVVNIGALGSAPHGAGRVMSRTAAAGKLRKMWYCNNRNCNFKPFPATAEAISGYPNGKCPECGLPLRKTRDRVRDASTAAVDWDAVRKDLNDRGIVVLGSGADEAPEVYKDLASVLAFHSNIEVLHTLHPIGVVMAGDDIRDPYKD